MTNYDAPAAAETKHVFTSKTYVGLALVIIPVALKLFGIELAPEAHAFLPAALNMVSDNIDALVQAVGAAFVAYGRIKDGTPVWIIKKPKE